MIQFYRDLTVEDIKMRYYGNCLTNASDRDIIEILFHKIDNLHEDYTNKPRYEICDDCHKCYDCTVCEECKYPDQIVELENRLLDIENKLNRIKKNIGEIIDDI